MKNNTQINNMTTQEVSNRGNAFTIPPRGQRFKNAQISMERFIISEGDNYYMRLFYDGSSEFVCFDEQSNKWVFLCFPAA